MVLFEFAFDYKSIVLKFQDIPSILQYTSLNLSSSLVMLYIEFRLWRRVLPWQQYFEKHALLNFKFLVYNQMKLDCDAWKRV